MVSDAFNIFALGDYKYRRINLIGAAAFLVFDIIISLLHIDVEKMGHFNFHLVLHYFVVIGLVAANLSKEKIDDERSKEIRYVSFKLAFSFMILLAGIAIYFMGFLGKVQIPTIYIMYFAEVILALTLALNWFGMRYNPKWLFREPTSPKQYNTLMIVVYIMMFVLLLTVLLIDKFLA